MVLFCLTHLRPSAATSVSSVFVKDMSQLEAIHEVRLRHFSKPYPTSTLVAVSDFVHPDALIEINAVAAVRSA
jgi:enamine deaminase RidA (YjgF/YER057c/UK114 family)